MLVASGEEGVGGLMSHFPALPCINRKRGRGRGEEQGI